MRIGIVGCGKFGSAVLDLMADMGHEITAIDTNLEVINEVNDTRDVLAICGNGADVKLLREIEVDRMDVFIACSVSDEINMLSSCFAKKMGARHTIARMRNQRHNSTAAAYIKEALDIDFIVNPDYLTAKAGFDILDKAPKGDTIILGANRISYYLAKMLLKSGRGVKLIDRDEGKCEYLCEQLPEEAIIINANAANHQLLINEGLLEVSGLASITDTDEENILTSLFALEQGVPSIVTNINKTSYTSIVNNLKLEHVISPRTATADIIVNYIKELDQNNEQKSSAVHSGKGSLFGGNPFRPASDSGADK